ncbi:MAG: FtsX-like permease family protein, partial [Bacteroidia bacterium]|nr:FtsX-like permease family protein [Bacteroidia bacterium]
GKILQDSLSKNVSTGFLVNEMLESKHSEVLGSDLRIYYGEYGRIIYEKKAEIVGVVKDFHIENLRTAVGPVVISLISEEERARQINHIMLRYREGAQEPVLAAIRDAWERVVGNYPIGLSFVDESIRKSYEEEETLGSLIGGFAIVAITLACLGLLGLVAFTTRQKTKEIGIRKTLGASQANILLLLGSEFASVLLLGTVISWLIAYYASKEWLSDYPYTAPSSFFSYLGSTAIGISMVMSIIAVLTIKESRKNPTDSLRQD